MTESLTAAAACGNPVHFEGTEKDVCSLLRDSSLQGLSSTARPFCFLTSRQRISIRQRQMRSGN